MEQEPHSQRENEDEKCETAKTEAFADQEICEAVSQLASRVADFHSSIHQVWIGQ